MSDDEEDDEPVMIMLGHHYSQFDSDLPNLKILPLLEGVLFLETYLMRYF